MCNGGAFQNYFITKYDIIPIHQECLNRISSHTTASLWEAANITFETPVTPGQLHYAIKEGNNNKAPGLDGICQEFFHTFWEVTKTELLQILNDMYMNHDTQDQQKHGLIVCLPKHKQAYKSTGWLLPHADIWQKDKVHSWTPWALGVARESTRLQKPVARNTQRNRPWPFGRPNPRTLNSCVVFLMCVPQHKYQQQYNETVLTIYDITHMTIRSNQNFNSAKTMKDTTM
jgi:hypothetical protein